MSKPGTTTPCSSRRERASRRSKAWCSGCSQKMNAIRSHQIWLVFGTRYEHGIYYKEEFKQIEREHPNFHYVCTLSRSEGDWSGCRGYVQDHVREIRSGPSWHDFIHLRALTTWVDHNRKMLMEEMGLYQKQIEVLGGD